MKSLELREIFEVINIPFPDHIKNMTVEHVINYSKREIDDATLVFHLDRDRIRGKYWKHNRSIIILTDRPDLCTDLGNEILLVETNRLEEAYWLFVEFYRSLFNIPIIGVTGTCGKTTTKEMIRQILLPSYKVKSTWMSMNSMSVNLRYLTGIDEETEVAVYEMPVAYPGYLKVACRYFKPQIRILLNIDVHHLADCETPEEYMKAKAEIVDGMDPENGILLLNGDDENIKKVVDVTPYKNVIYFGKNENADFRASNIEYAEGGMKFILENKGNRYTVFVPGVGEHNVYNAMAAIIAVLNVGIDIPTAVKRLATFEQVEEHLEFKNGINGCIVIDDTWNSAPLSMASGLQVLSDLSVGKNSIALLGYMPQLGDGPFATIQYEEMGKKAFEANIDQLIVVGEEAEAIRTGAIKSGMDPSRVHLCYTGKEVFELLQPYLNENTIILLKITHRVMKKTSFVELRRKIILSNNE